MLMVKDLAGNTKSNTEATCSRIRPGLAKFDHYNRVLGLVSFDVIGMTPAAEKVHRQRIMRA
jgi:hypothetical protein